MSKKLNLQRGFASINDKVSKNSKLLKSCYNCEFYYQASGDKEECCQNTNVTRYDIVMTENNICCSYWKLFHSTKTNSGKPMTVKALFQQRLKGSKNES